jgi:hypothetical protein
MELRKPTTAVYPMSQPENQNGTAKGDPMTKIRDFNDFMSEAMERSRRAAEAVRHRHAEKPLVGRVAIAAAFKEELERLEASAFTVDDELAFRSMKIAL